MVRDRFQWGSYGFVAGIVVGVVLGWLFNRVVGTILWVGLVVVLLVLAFTAWRWVTSRGRELKEDVETRVEGLRGGGRNEVVETESFVVETRAEPRARPQAAPRSKPRER